MPLYEYKCAKCGQRFEKIEPYSASEIKKCPKCGGKAERQIAPSAIQFKGTGWYVTDYAGKGSAAKPNEGASGDGASKPADKPGESKPAATEKTQKPSEKKKK